MFASPNTAGPSGPGSWLDDSHDILLSAQDVLDYTSFSDSDSPVLSLESFSSQHSPDLDAYCFNDFAPLSEATPFDFQPSSAVPIDVDNITMAPEAAKPSATETARQAALLHAYLAAQTQSSAQLQQQQQQQQWALSVVAQNDQYQKELEKKKEDEKAHFEQLIKVQQSDAENLARFLAQSVKQEESEPAMEDDSVSTPQSPSSSSDGEKSPMASPTMAERSLSPEAQTSKNSKASRHLVCFNCKVTQTPLWRRTPDRKHSLCNACGLYYKQYGAHRPLHVRHKLPTVLTDVRAMPYARPSNQSSRGSSPSPVGLELPFTFSSTASAPDSSASSDSDSDSGRLQSFPDLTKMYSQALMRPPVQKITPPLMTAKQGIECANCSQTQTPLWRKNDAGEPICNACGLYAKLHNRDRPVTMRKTKITRRRRDWGGNLAHQAQAQAQALAFAHAQAQAQAQAQARSQASTKGSSVSDGEQATIVASIVEEMNRKAQALMNRTSTAPSVHSSDSEEECPPTPSPTSAPLVPVAAPAPAPTSSGLANNLIMDENKFTDMVGQMNAHQMNRFLSILETRCGVLRERLLASTEGSQESSSLDHLF